MYGENFSHERIVKENLMIKNFILQGIFRLIGFAFLAFAIFGFLALCSWNALDPSLSHATSNKVQNLMGYLGAIFSDMGMQLLGLSSILSLFPILGWAQKLILARPLHRILLRSIAYLLSTLLLGGAIACILPPKTWPLPVGLGGALGDLISIPIIALLNNQLPYNLEKLVVFLFFLSIGTFLSLWSSGVLFSTRQYSRKNIAYTASDIENIDLDDEEPAEKKNSLSLFLGSILHVYLFTKSFFKRIHKTKKTAINMNRRIEPDLFLSKNTNLSNPPCDDDNLFEETIETALPPQNTLMKNFYRNLSKKSYPIEEPTHPNLVHSVLKAKQSFEMPSLKFLSEPKNITRDLSLSKEILQKNARVLEEILDDFGVKGQIIQIRPGPVVTLYELEPAPGIKSSRVISLSDDIARSMSAASCRVAVVSGRNVIGIEIPNLKRETVYLHEIFTSRNFREAASKLPLALGKSINGEPIVVDITKMPHVLVAGTTGSGKSVAINTMILSILYKLKPEECRLIMIDPKMLELSVYSDIPHLLTPVVTDPQKAVVALKWTVREMEDRYRKMSKIGVRNIDGFNAKIAEAQKNKENINRTVQTGFDQETGKAIYETEKLEFKKMPYIVVIIDEMADLMMVAGKEIEGAVQRLAQMARAAGIHVIMATQRPSVDVITGTIKANFPTRISFQVTSKIDSRTILGEQGAEQLLGMGDMLYMAGGGKIQRVHGPFVSDVEVEKVVKHLKLQGMPEYLDAITKDDSEEKKDWEKNVEDSDDPYNMALEVVLRDRKVSTSYIQRRLGIGYNRAASIIERMEAEGIIGAANHAGKREILIESEENPF